MLYCTDFDINLSECYDYEDANFFNKVMEGHIRSSVSLEIRFFLDIFFLKSDLIKILYECEHNKVANFS